MPAVVDLTTGKIVNNDYFSLTLYFETDWKKYHRKGTPDLYPKSHLREIDALSAEIFHDVNNGVCKAGFTQSQGANSDAFHLVFGAFDRLEERLSKRRFLFGFWTEVLTHSTSHTAKSAEAMAPALFHTCSVTDIAPVLITS